MFCANASDGILTAHPALKGKLLTDIKDKKGFPLGLEIMGTASEGKISEVTYLVASPRLGGAPREGHLFRQGRRPDLRRRLLQVS